MRTIVAGTFGPIHDGHRALFRTALERGDGGVLVGLTTDAFATAHRDREVLPFDDRRERLHETLSDLNEWGREVETREVADRVGFAGTEPDVDALVTSPETCGAIATINREHVADDEVGKRDDVVDTGGQKHHEHADEDDRAVREWPRERVGNHGHDEEVRSQRAGRELTVGKGLAEADERNLEEGHVQ